MTPPIYIGLSDARNELAAIGIELSERQMKRAADKDAQGRRKLPFFLDPITGTLKIREGIFASRLPEFTSRGRKKFTGTGLM